MTLSDLEWLRNIRWHEASRGLSATAELLVCASYSIGISFASNKYWMDFNEIGGRGGNHFHQQINWSHFGQNYTGDNDRKFASTSNRCCHVANDFKNFAVHTARCVRRAGKSITRMRRRRHHMTVSGLWPSSNYALVRLKYGRTLTTSVTKHAVQYRLHVYWFWAKHMKFIRQFNLDSNRQI